VLFMASRWSKASSSSIISPFAACRSTPISLPAKGHAQDGFIPRIYQRIDRKGGKSLQERARSDTDLTQNSRRRMDADGHTHLVTGLEGGCGGNLQRSKRVKVLLFGL
jgi:hypothetical protein